jgi:hypothetical protein
MWKNMVQPDRPQMTIRRMRFACWIPKPTNTHSENAPLIAFPRQQWLHERASTLRYAYIACLVNCIFPCAPFHGSREFHLRSFHRSDLPLRTRLYSTYDGRRVHNFTATVCPIPSQLNPILALLSNFFKTTLILSSRICPDLPSDLARSGFLTKTLCAFLFSPTRDTCPVQPKSRFLICAPILGEVFSPLLIIFIYCRKMVYWYDSWTDSNVFCLGGLVACMVSRLSNIIFETCSRVH